MTKGYRPDPQIYVRLIQESENLGGEGEFSPCFTELQTAFLKERPAKLKSLIRLVKHWYQLVRPVPSGQRAEEEEEEEEEEEGESEAGEEGGVRGGREGAGRGEGRRKKRRGGRRGGIRKDAGGRREPDRDGQRGGKASQEGEMIGGTWRSRHWSEGEKTWGRRVGSGTLPVDSGIFLFRFSLISQ